MVMIVMVMVRSGSLYLLFPTSTRSPIPARRRRTLVAGKEQLGGSFGN
jgi:hypothetical protein